MDQQTTTSQTRCPRRMACWSMRIDSGLNSNRNQQAVCPHEADCLMNCLQLTGHISQLLHTLLLLMLLFWTSCYWKWVDFEWKFSTEQINLSASTTELVNSLIKIWLSFQVKWMILPGAMFHSVIPVAYRQRDGNNEGCHDVKRPRNARRRVVLRPTVS